MATDGLVSKLGTLIYCQIGWQIATPIPWIMLANSLAEISPLDLR